MIDHRAAGDICYRRRRFVIRRRHGMATSEPRAGEPVKDVRFTEDTISVDLVDSRTVTAPLAWYHRLLHATAQERENWRISGVG